jgi:hypothetical protein
MSLQNEYFDKKIYLDLEHPKTNDRLDVVNIPKGLVELLTNAGFTIEIILKSKPSDIAQRLGIDYYIAQIIYHVTKNHYRVKG